MSVRRRTIPLVEDSPRKMSLCESHPNTGQVCLCRLHFSQVCVPQFYRSLLKRWQNLQPCDMIITLGCVTLFFKQPLEGKPFTHVSWEGIHKYWLDIEWPIFLVQSHSHHHQDVNQSAGFLSNSRRCKNTPPTTKKTLIAPAPLCFFKTSWNSSAPSGMGPICEEQSCVSYLIVSPPAAHGGWRFLDGFCETFIIFDFMNASWCLF